MIIYLYEISWLLLHFSKLRNQNQVETSEGDSNCKTPVETPLWLPAAAVLLTIIQEHSSITIETIKKILYQ
ncbi:hypothetical protein PV328_008424 [Microctonus aethiopoides]|uniref:Uncharacterized protein n=1 Tax=Microctonus aethiopoides TaxID=144406 RepID=A0AA39FJ73_9HYME|nr:hypothetical protein PV328_008424 [Microctonus aethiopoides]